MLTKLTFHEIHSLSDLRIVFAGKALLTALPYAITNDLAIEDVSGWLTDETLDWVSKAIGTHRTETLKRVKFALVHRYSPGSFVTDGDEDFESAKLVRTFIELVHIIRPMRQHTSVIRAEQTDDGTKRVVNLDEPEQLDVPDVQKLNSLRSQDLSVLKSLAPAFLAAMRGKFEKFWTSVFYHAVGRKIEQGNARYLLWCSAIEALYTSHHPEHKGSLVATERIKWFLGPSTNIYETGDIPDYILDQPTITVGDVVDKIYKVRNYIAHGDVIPREYFITTMREGVGGEVATIEVLSEAASFVVRRSLLRILQDGLLQYFVNAQTTDAYFGGQGLTKSLLERNKRASKGSATP